MRDPIIPAEPVFGALLRLEDDRRSPADVNVALLGAVALLDEVQPPGPRPRRAGRTIVPAGRPLEPVASRVVAFASSLPVAPAPGAVPRLDERRTGVIVFRTLCAGPVLGREVPAGSRVLAARREPQAGDVVVVRSGKRFRLLPLRDVPVSALQERHGPAPGDRCEAVGVVEAVIA